MNHRLDMNAYTVLMIGVLHCLHRNANGDIRNDFLSSTQAVLRQRFGAVNGLEQATPSLNTWTAIYECLTRRRPPLTRANINAADALLREEEYADQVQFALNEFQEDDRLTALLMLTKSFEDTTPYYEEKMELAR